MTASKNFLQIVLMTSPTENEPATTARFLFMCAEYLGGQRDGVMAVTPEYVEELDGDAARVERHANHRVDTHAVEGVDFGLRSDPAGNNQLPGRGGT